MTDLATVAKGLTKAQRWRKFWRWLSPPIYVRDLRLIHWRYRAEYRDNFYEGCGEALGALLHAYDRGRLGSQVRNLLEKEQ